ncbi:lipopolysaccharide biosynthesis protein [Fictibacillus macauensis ZFHKF-1]|uniref:Lipopolysaccharide biosynthesis protein n=1 Tax=Fictibacillus macauensis ZFHKF-1 TaxID=1196324 RepID=I8UB23_9BACL|nr:Wzz/FepE/Etk N-terminal domain-containing protein [Fictibacillus macauensis]EIT83968.1 lipopolysaccharide biosynthesis protein [Fictibacillus macauensis ZFHKF-1]
MEETISLKEVYRTIRKRMLMIVLIAIGAMVISGVVSFFIVKPVYQSSTQILVNQDGKKEAYDYNQVQTNVQLVNTYSVIIKSPAILNKVITTLQLNETVEELTKKLTINSEQNSQVFNVTVEDGDPKRAVLIANTIADVFKEDVPSIMKIKNVSILSQATEKDDAIPVKPNKKMNVAIGFVVGLMAAVGLAFLLEYLDNTVKSEEEVEEWLDLPVLGSIPLMSAKDSKEDSLRKKIS